MTVFRGNAGTLPVDRNWTDIFSKRSVWGKRFDNLLEVELGQAAASAMRLESAYTVDQSFHYLDMRFQFNELESSRRRTDRDLAAAMQRVQDAMAVGRL